MFAKNEEMSLETLREDMAKKNPTLQYWDLALEFEMLALILIRAQRSNNFNLFAESLEALMPWFFTLDHTNYSRWILIHSRDLKLLPSVVKEELK